MDLVFCTEARLVRRSSGLVYSIDGGLTNNLWQRYLCKFNHVYVMASVLSDDDCPINDKYLASSEHVSFIDLPQIIRKTSIILYTKPEDLRTKRASVQKTKSIEYNLITLF